jgi:hypothetical protein
MKMIEDEETLLIDNYINISRHMPTLSLKSDYDKIKKIYKERVKRDKKDRKERDSHTFNMSNQGCY